MSDAIKIAIYEDEDSYRELLRQLIQYESSLELTGSFENCDQVEKDMTSCNPEIVLMDINFNKNEKENEMGIEALIKIKSLFPNIDIIMLTEHEQEKSIFQCIRKGASGYISKGDPLPLMIRYLHLVKQDKKIYGPTAATSVTNKAFPENKNTIQLTDREKEVLLYIASGRINKEVAVQIRITIDGVASHMRKIFEKLDVHNAPEAVAKAIRLGIIDRDEIPTN